MLSFMQAHPGKAFNAGDLADGTGLEPRQASNAAYRLFRLGYLRRPEGVRQGVYFYDGSPKVVSAVGTFGASGSLTVGDLFEVVGMDREKMPVVRDGAGQLFHLSPL